MVNVNGSVSNFSQKPIAESITARAGASTFLYIGMISDAADADGNSIKTAAAMAQSGRADNILTRRVHEVAGAEDCTPALCMGIFTPVPIRPLRFEHSDLERTVIGPSGASADGKLYANHSVPRWDIRGDECHACRLWPAA